MNNIKDMITATLIATTIVKSADEVNHIVRTL